jgi:hypothetical protein
LFNQSPILSAALGVTKFILTIDMILVTPVVQQTGLSTPNKFRIRKNFFYLLSAKNYPKEEPSGNEPSLSVSLP